MKIAITLVHNLTSEENEAQIETFFNLVTEQIELLPGTDEEGNTIPNAFERYYYTLNGLELPHEVEFFHIIPFQPDNLSEPYNAVLPNNIYLLKGINVQYGKGDEDKTGNHPRFFNWGLKRGTDYGADVVIHVDDYKTFSVDNLAFQLNSLVDPEDNHEFVEDGCVKICSCKLLIEVGQLNESLSTEDAIVDFKERNVENGGKNG